MIQEKTQKIFFKDLFIWLSSLSHQNSSNRIIVGLSNEKGFNRLYLDMNKNKLQVEHKIQLHLPSLKVNLEKKECLRIIRMAEKIGNSYQNLSKYLKYLSNEFKKIDINPLIEVKNRKQISPTV